MATALGQVNSATNIHDITSTVGAISNFRAKGTAGGVSDFPYYTSPCVNAGLGTIAAVVDTIYAMPFLVGETITADRIAIDVNGIGTATAARLGIYNNGNRIPTTLLLDAGTVDVTLSGFKEITISQALTGGKLYWLVFLQNGTSTIDAVGQPDQISILGINSVLGKLSTELSAKQNNKTVR